MINLFEEYPEKKESKRINLFDEYNDYNKPGTPAEALALSKKQISAKYPNLPDFVRDALLQITPREKSPLLESAAKGFSDVANYVPATVGGILQGASIPIRGIAGLVPTEFSQKLANSPNLTELFPKPETPGQEAAQMAGELAGGAGLFGKLLSGARGAAELARIPGVIGRPAALAATGYAGIPGDTEDRVMGSAAGLALGGAGKAINKASQKIPPFMKGLFSESTPEALVASIQKPHDILKGTADEFYHQVKNAVKNRNIKVPMKEEFLEQAKEYFPQRTTSTKELFERAKKGDYEAIHDIQSSLYKKGTKQLSADDLVKENEGEDILNLRDRINDYLESGFLKAGHTDVAHALSQGKKAYSNVMKTYYDPNLRKSIGKMVNQEIRMIPQSPENIFKENSVPMRRFLQSHPEAAKHAQDITNKKEAMHKLHQLLLKTGGTGATIAGTKAIFDLFK